MGDTPARQLGQDEKVRVVEIPEYQGQLQGEEVVYRPYYFGVAKLRALTNF